MDNRKVYRSYRDRIKSNHPYSTPGSSISSKVKGLLGLWNSIKSTSSSPKDDQQTPTFKFPEPKVVTEVTMPGAFQNEKTTIVPPPSVTSSATPSVTPSMPPTSTNIANDSSPNKILSKFFQEKGDKPLTDVEYEGVMALMSKSKQGTPYKRSRIGSIDDQSLIDQTFEPLFKKNKVDTSYTQKTLVSTPNITISTPEYHPTYHTIENDLANTSFNKSIPSIKRVYQFSGLPSPYRTRIKPPSFISTRKNLHSHRANKTMNNISTTENMSTKSFVSGPSTSSTAKTLLSILDGKSQQSEQETSTQDKLKLFTNPYGKRIKKSKQETPSITANDIEKTILYDKSEPLPELSVNVSSPISSVIEKEKENKSVEVPPPNGRKTEEVKPAPAFTFGKDIPVKATTTTKKVEAKPIDEPTVVSTTIEEFTNTDSNIEFEFPKVDVVHVIIDEKEVEKFKPMFEF